VLVRFRKSASEENITQCLSSADATTISIIEELGVWVVNIPYGKVAESIAIISTCPEVRYVEPNYMASAADTIPSDPFWNWQYGLSNIHAFQGWDYSTGSTAVTIAIVDSGVDLDHPDLSSKIVSGYNAFNDSSNANDDHFQSHGTHVAGIAAATSNNGIGVTGVSWGARIMPVKVLNSFGLGPLSIVAKGIVWATDHGAQVINLSLGITSDSPTLQDAINYASGHGVVLVAAAGNDTTTANLRYPAQYPNVIAVGAVDSGNNRTASSNYGPELDLVAPGQLIYSTITGSYGYLSGTSMAAPYVSGLAAVLYGMPGNSSSALVTTQMESSAADLGLPGFDNEYGFGLIQMDRALMLVPMPARTISPAGAGGGNLFSNPGVATFALGPTNTSTNTPTASPSATSLPDTASPTASITPTIQPSPTLEKQQARKRNLPEWQLPCAGLIFILAGLLLIWAMRGKKGRKF
jgi:subtilisin family serine protease